METKFTQEQSVELIKDMIQQAKGNAYEGMGTGVMLLWGYAMAIASMANFLIFQLELPFNYIGYMWATIIFISIIIMVFLIRKENKVKRIKTYTDTIADNVWLGFGVGVALITLVLVEKGIFYYPAITFIYAFAIFMTSVVYKVKGLLISVLIIIGCLISYKFIPQIYWPLSMAIAMLCGNIIPGHILNLEHKKNAKRA